MVFEVDELKAWVVILETAACRDMSEVGGKIRAIRGDIENEAQDIVNDLAREQKEISKEAFSTKPKKALKI